MNVPPVETLAKACSRQLSRRAALGRLGVGGLAASLSGLARPATSWAQAATPVPPAAAGGAPGLPPFVYRLEQSAPQQYAGGTLRTVTADNIPRLKGLAIFAEVIQPGALRELHWHPNAHELAYVLTGEGVMGIFDPDGTNPSFPIMAGSAGFVPAGYAHYIANTGTRPLHLVVAFSDERPEHLDFSVAMPPMPTSLVAETFGVSPAAVPLLPQRGDRTIVPYTGTITPPAVSAAAKQFTINIDQIKPNVYIGGTTHPIVASNLPSLEAMSVFPLHADPYGLREPHWHTNASELNYCVSGRAQIGLVAPNGGTQTFVVEAGDVCYIPVNWFHYIANVTGDPLEFLVFFSDPSPTHIDLSQLPAALPADVLAASFGVNPQVFASLPKRGDVFIASAKLASPATPAA